MAPERSGQEGRSTPDLVERERELDTLEAVAREAADGRGRVLLLEGPAGIGKSRLLAELRGRAHAAGTRTLAARGGELERELPFGVARQLFEALVAGPAPAVVLEGASAPARAVFGALGDEDAGASFAVLHGLYWLVLDLAAQGPVLLCVDDLHWCDAASLRFLGYLARRLEDQPVLLAATLRTGEPGTASALVAEIAHAPEAVAVRPDPLSHDAVRALAAARLGAEPDEAFARACLEATGGNPLLLGQLLDALRAEHVRPDAAQVDLVRRVGPRAVARSVLLRLARLPEAARATAGAVAVLGEAADVGALAAMTGLDEAAAAEAVRALARSDLLVDELPLRFVHPLVRAAIYQDLGPGRRELEHARAAEILQGRGAPADEVAGHLLLMPPRGRPEAAELLHEAARGAMRRGAVDSAVAFLGRALREPPAPERRPVLLLELGQAEAMFDAAAAAGHLRQAAEGLPDPVARATAAYFLTRVLLFCGETAEARAVCAAAAAACAGADDPRLVDLRLGLEAMESMSAFFGEDVAEDRARLLARAPARTGSGPGARGIAAIAAWTLLRQGAPASEVVPPALEALEDDALLDFDDGFLAPGAFIPLVLADREEGFAAVERLAAHAHRRGSVFAELGLKLWGGLAQLARGDLPAAETALRSNLGQLARYGRPQATDVFPVAFLARTLLERDDVAGARAVLDAYEPSRTAEMRRLWLGVQSAVLVAERRPQEALAAVDELRGLVAGLDAPAWAPWRPQRALALQGLGRTAEARADAEEEAALARAFGAPSVIGRSLRLLGTLRGDEGLLREAVEVLEGSSARLELARALAALGGHLRRTREPTQAREPLRRALDMAAACGADGLVRDVRAELQAAGLRPRTTALGGVPSLTASERRVADLAAGGRTNREIAQELYVTPKTVEVHLSNAYRKLGIDSRRALPEALGAAA